MVKTKTIVAICAMAALTQVANTINASQHKEAPNTRPITVTVDSQHKEAPNTRPGVIQVIRAWFAQILPDSQHKE